MESDLLKEIYEELDPLEELCDLVGRAIQEKNRRLHERRAESSKTVIMKKWIVFEKSKIRRKELAC